MVLVRIGHVQGMLLLLLLLLHGVALMLVLLVVHRVVLVLPNGVMMLVAASLTKLLVVRWVVLVLEVLARTRRSVRWGRSQRHVDVLGGEIGV